MEQEQLSHDNSKCLNCGQALYGKYCHHCGQPVETNLKFFGSIVSDFLNSLLSYDSKIYRTIVPLIFKPWQLCNEYLGGHRIKHLAPFRLYLFISIVFFIFVPVIADINPEVDITNVDIENRPAEAPALDIPFVSDARNREIELRLDEILTENPRAIFESMINYLPTLMFLLIPLFALSLKILYLFSKKYFMEHVVIVLFTQSFLFIMLMMVFSLGQLRTSLFNNFPDLAALHSLTLAVFMLSLLWIPAGLFLVQLNVYQQSGLVTFIKFILISLLYISMLGITITSAVLVGIFNI